MLVCPADDLHALRGRALGRSARGLPYLTIMVDDSASAAIADQYAKPEERSRPSRALAASAREAPRK